MLAKYKIACTSSVIAHISALAAFPLKPYVNA